MIDESVYKWRVAVCGACSRMWMCRRGDLHTSCQPTTHVQWTDRVETTSLATVDIVKRPIAAKDDIQGRHLSLRLFLVHMRVQGCIPCVRTFNMARRAASVASLAILLYLLKELFAQFKATYSLVFSKYNESPAICGQFTCMMHARKLPVIRAICRECDSPWSNDTSTDG
jgi:hypothetical protein